ncbi:disheveled-associated activator of morphogenesis 1-like isoform X2 [Tachypleus tridentatus]|uniref:disheveled-associated activator of morphogenesis 1-like isoform X2 n=1 Tax=Tachypleus tridentatus TaxID=6853 RepID=UPI003FD5B851
MAITPETGTSTKHLVLTAPTNLTSMPVKKKNEGLCNCFGTKEPPEITYYVVENGGVVNLQPHLLGPTQPVPGEEELNVKFAELVEELDLTAAKKEIMFSLPPEKKLQLYLSKKSEQQQTSSAHFSDYYVERVNSMSMLLFPRDQDEIALRIQLLDNLKTALRTQPNSFVMRFLEQDGLVCLLNFLKNMEYDTSESAIHTSVIGCVKALMNNSSGRSHVLAHHEAINTISQSLATDNIKAKTAVLEILGAVCLVPGGHHKVLEAMLYFQRFAYERTRFQTIVNDLDRSTGLYKEEVGLNTAIMSFINAIINYGPGQNHLEFRLHLRYEFLMLGIQPIIDKLRTYENGTLDRHLDIFELVRNDDEKELARRFDATHVDTKSATAVFEVLKQKLALTAAYPHFLSLLTHCLLLPVCYGACPEHWLLCDRIVQQVVLQGNDGMDPDVSHVEINVKEVVKLLATEEEVSSAKERAEVLEKENCELILKCSKKEQEIEQHLQEKEDLQALVKKMKVKLERETVGHIQACQKIEELEYRLEHISQAFESEQKQQHTQVSNLIQNGSLSDDTKVEISASKSAAPPPPPPPPIASPGLAGPPPPPPPLLSKRISCVKPYTPVKKNIPQSSNPLKSFNWSKLHENKLEGTVWMELDDTKLYKDIDLNEIDKMFSAYQKQQCNDSVEDLIAVTSRTTPRSREFSVIDGRRAQNCTILLSKLRLSNEDICKMILDMDHEDQLPKDMLEQLLKFTPNPEEKALLEEHRSEIESMARADRFLYEISRVVHYEQRVKTLLYKKKFQERISDCKSKIEAVSEGSREVQRSKRLKKLLEVILAFGNYMNKGQRGNAMGFRLVSLNKIGDTKSGINRNITLLHFLIETLEKKFKDILKLEEDIPHVRQAAKVNMTELSKEIQALKMGLQEIQKEMEFYRMQQEQQPGDKFVPIMREFITSATYQFSELEDSYQDMKQLYEEAVRLYGEDPTQIQPDEFFAIFDSFLTSYNEARQECDNMKKKKEFEEKRAHQELEFKRDKSGKDFFNKSGNDFKNGSISELRTHHESSDKGEFDDLISALRTGDVFGDDLAKFRRNKRRGIVQQSSTLGSDVMRNSRRERISSSMRTKNA